MLVHQEVSVVQLLAPVVGDKRMRHTLELANSTNRLTQTLRLSPKNRHSGITCLTITATGKAQRRQLSICVVHTPPHGKRHACLECHAGIGIPAEFVSANL
jgi:hypothetical protein